MSDARRVEVAAALDDDRLADVLEELPEHDQVEIIGRADPGLGPPTCWRRWDPDDAARPWLAELPQSDQDVLLDLMEPDEAEPGAATAALPAGARPDR